MATINMSAVKVNIVYVCSVFGEGTNSVISQHS